MAITGAKWCDFVFYTKKGISIERIPFDPEFSHGKVKQLTSFFFRYFLPKYIKIQETVVVT